MSLCYLCQSVLTVEVSDVLQQNLTQCPYGHYVLAISLDGREQIESFNVDEYTIINHLLKGIFIHRKFTNAEQWAIVKYNDNDLLYLPAQVPVGSTADQLQKLAWMPGAKDLI